MRNPWEEISLDDYESHMRLDSVMQLQAMNQLMKGQLAAFPVRLHNHEASQYLIPYAPSHH